MAEKVFQICLTENEKPRNHPDYCITFDYELLDVFSQWDDTTPGIERCGEGREEVIAYKLGFKCHLRTWCQVYTAFMCTKCTHSKQQSRLW